MNHLFSLVFMYDLQKVGKVSLFTISFIGFFVATQAQAPQFGQPKLANCANLGTLYSDVFFDDNDCDANVYVVGRATQEDVNYNIWAEDFVTKYNRTTFAYSNQSCPVTSSSIGMESEANIGAISANNNGYLSYIGNVYDSNPMGNNGYYINNTLFEWCCASVPLASAVLTAPDNHTYTAGIYFDSLDLGNNVVLYPPAGSSSSNFLIKQLWGTPEWAINLPENIDVSIMKNLSNSSFMLMGTFSGVVTLNGFTINANTGGNMFLAKFLDDGTCTALKQVTAGAFTLYAAKVRYDGTMYVTGTHSNGAIVAGTTLNGVGVFTAKFDTSGNALTAIHIGATSGNNYTDMDIDQNGNTFLLEGSSISKYNLNNTLAWTTSVSTFNPQSVGGSLNISPNIYGIGVDKRGNVGIAGVYDIAGGLSIGNTGWIEGGDSSLCDFQQTMWGLVPSTTIGFFSLALDTMQSLYASATTICSGGTVTLSFNAGLAANTYTWQQSVNGGANWSNVTGINPSSTSINATLTATRMYRVIYNVVSCNSSGIDTTNALTINVVADPVISVSSNNNNFCSGGNATLTANLSGGAGTGVYQWQRNVNGVWANLTGATAATYTTPSLSVSTNYKVVANQNVAGCNAVGASSISLIVKTLPNIYTNPTNPAFCVGGSVNITAYNGTAYSWSPATGLNNTNSNIVTANPSASTVYSLTAVGVNGCSKTISVPVTVNADPSITITGDTIVCAGGTVVLNSSSAGGAGSCVRQWQSSTNGINWTNISGATGASYTTASLGALTYYRVTFSCNAGGCSPAAVSNVHKVKLFDNSITAFNAINTVCTGGSVKLLAPTIGSNVSCSYLWESSVNNSTWTAIAGANSNFYYPPTATANIRYYRVTSNCAGLSCTAVPSAPFLVTVNADPSVSISGVNSICGSGTTTLTAVPAGGTGVATYQWQENIANVFNNIAGATNLTYTTPVLTASKTYRVLYTVNGLGCGSANSANYSITIKTLPSIYTSPSSATICIGGSQNIIAYNGTNYSWSPATGLSATNGSPVVASPTSTTIYSLTGTGSNGCTKTITIPINVNADPIISITGPNSVPNGTTAMLTASVGNGAGSCAIQWQSSVNGTSWTNITGATSATYTTPAITGTRYYRANYTCSASGCSPTATSNILSIVGISAPVRLAEPVYALNLYPNPANMYLNISLATVAEEKIVFSLHDILGKKFSEWEGKAENGVYETAISLEELSQGIYFISTKVGNRIITEKFVKE